MSGNVDKLLVTSVSVENNPDFYRWTAVDRSSGQEVTLVTGYTHPKVGSWIYLDWDWRQL